MWTEVLSQAKVDGGVSSRVQTAGNLMVPEKGVAKVSDEASRVQ